MPPKRGPKDGKRGPLRGAKYKKKASSKSGKKQLRLRSQGAGQPFQLTSKPAQRPRAPRAPAQAAAPAPTPAPAPAPPRTSPRRRTAAETGSLGHDNDAGHRSDDSGPTLDDLRKTARRPQTEDDATPAAPAPAETTNEPPPALAPAAAPAPGPARRRRGTAPRPISPAPDEQCEDDPVDDEPEASASQFEFMSAQLERLKGTCNFTSGGTVSSSWPHFATVLGLSRPEPLSGVLQHKPTLTIDDFNNPKCMYWAPELQFQQYYPDGRPCCPIHGCTNCVRHKGWRPRPRRAVDVDGPAFVWGRAYKCTLTDQCFSSYSVAVIAAAPLPVLNYWKQHGYHITKRSAIRYTLVEQLRASLANGFGVGGSFLCGSDQNFNWPPRLRREFVSPTPSTRHRLVIRRDVDAGSEKCSWNGT